MKISRRTLGIITLILAILVSIHWYLVHLSVGMLQIDIGIATIILYIFAGYLLYSKKKLGHTMIGAGVIIASLLIFYHWCTVHLLRFFEGDPSQLYPELGIAFFGTIVLGGILVSGKLKVTS